MAIHQMDRKAEDNVYFHRDFHATINISIAFLREQYGDAAVLDYLRRFTRHYFMPLRSDLQQRGLIALREYWQRIYDLEGGDARITGDDQELLIETAWCPAERRIHERAIPLDPLFFETTRTVNEALCEDSPFAASYERLDDATGASRQRFYRRPDPSGIASTCGEGDRR